MLKSTEVILRNYGETDHRARECLFESQYILNARELSEDLIEEIVWAYTVLITEVILLDAFRENDETSDEDIDNLINEASRKINLLGYIEVITESQCKIMQISEKLQPSIEQIQQSVFVGLAEVTECLLEKPWYETLIEKPAYQEARMREKSTVTNP